ncbi:DUF418 domain-containing protein [Sphingomonas sp. RB56-2]|uniref:DUF418 domain-containing protein n=1 Tax=Sphingomonas brevis TaxID=2908206 RepID=A0ABT0S8R7_9SPHN|nr:DUF418 domain-containing protein [Sphingomonas brevis]MCL6740784.1 DUF418 domain-containing protein [Sphingomonas brevis]
MVNSIAAPTGTRLESLDFIRGCALFGILIMNIVGMGMGPAYDNPRVMGGDTGINLWTWFVVNVTFEGTQRALFSILFGAGVILFTSRPDSTDAYFRRNLWLIAFGLFNAWILLWGGDILYFYGLTALFLFAFRNLPGKKLLGLGIASFVLGAAWSGLDTYNMLDLHKRAVAAESIPAAQRSEQQKGAIEQWTNESRGGPSPERVVKLKEENQAGYISALRVRAPRIAEAQSWYAYRNFFDIFGMMMIGMALFKLGVLTLEARTRTYLAMMVGGYAIGMPLNLFEANWLMSHGFSGLARHQTAITYDFARLAQTTGHLGLLGLFLKSGMLSWFRTAMAAVGRMALTNYLTHSAVALIIFVFLGYWGTLERHQLYYIVFAIWAAQIVISPIWLKHFHFGPVEWLWRYLTYGKQPPFRREAPASGARPLPAG